MSVGQHKEQVSDTAPILPVLARAYRGSMASDFTLRLTRLEVMTPEQLAALEALIRLCRKDGIEGEIAYRPPATAGQSHWWETTLVYMDDTMLETAPEARVREVADILARRASEWARSRLEQGQTTRPQSVLVLDPSGLPVHKVQVGADEATEELPGTGR